MTGTFVTNANHFLRVVERPDGPCRDGSVVGPQCGVDAAELFAHGVNLMREHLEPTARLHYIYEIAGVAPNIVPAEVRIRDPGA